VAKKSTLIDCIFCGNEQVPRAVEDVIPLWLANKMAHYAVEEQRAQGKPGDNANYVSYVYAHPDQMAKDADDNTMGANASSTTPIGKIPNAFLLPDVCGTCNSGWMSNLEEVAKKLIPGLLEGRSKTIDPFEQLILAMWVIKTCIAYDATNEERFIPEEYGSRHLFNLGYPLPGTQVVIGHDAGTVQQGQILHGRTRYPAEGVFVRSVHIGLRFDHFMCYMALNMVDPPDEREQMTRILEHLGRPWLTEIWPPKGRLPWPTEEAKATRSPC
jgi:hypothetical protein